jgi:hypothetical protein
MDWAKMTPCAGCAARALPTRPHAAPHGPTRPHAPGFPARPRGRGPVSHTHQKAHTRKSRGKPGAAETGMERPLREFGSAPRSAPRCSALFRFAFGTNAPHWRTPVLMALQALRLLRHHPRPQPRRFGSHVLRVSTAQKWCSCPFPSRTHFDVSSHPLPLAPSSGLLHIQQLEIGMRWITVYITALPAAYSCPCCGGGEVRNAVMPSMPRAQCWSRPPASPASAS